MPIILPASSLFRVQLNQGIDPHDSDASLDRALELFHFTHAGLEHASADLVDHFAAREVEAVVFVIAALGREFLVVFFLPCGAGGGVVFAFAGAGGRGCGGGGWGGDFVADSLR